MFGRHFYGHHMHGPARMFEKGDLKYVILDLLKDKPAHGYEIIKELEERFHGFYSPSAGSVYPTLQLLEDMGYVKSAEQDGKKIYTITDAGRKFLTEREDTIDRIKDHMDEFWDEDREELRDIMYEFRDLRDAARTFAHRAGRLDKEKVNKIKDIIRKARNDIEAILAEK
jgi:DNA-binding PadR family transcriptional regulator